MLTDLCVHGKNSLLPTVTAIIKLECKKKLQRLLQYERNVYSFVQNKRKQNPAAKMILCNMEGIQCSTDQALFFFIQRKTNLQHPTRCCYYRTVLTKENIVATHSRSTISFRDIIKCYDNFNRMMRLPYY